MVAMGAAQRRREMTDQDAQIELNQAALIFAAALTAKKASQVHKFTVDADLARAEHAAKTLRLKRAENRLVKAAQQFHTVMADEYGNGEIEKLIAEVEAA